MSELRESLDAYTRGETTVEALSAHIDRRLADSPTDAADILQSLAAAKAGGLPAEVYEALIRRLRGVVKRPAATAGDARGESSGDPVSMAETTRAPDATVVAARQNDAEPGTSPETDVTLFNQHESSHRVPPTAGRQTSAADHTITTGPASQTPPGDSAGEVTVLGDAGAERTRVGAAPPAAGSTDATRIDPATFSGTVTGPVESTRASGHDRTITGPGAQSQTLDFDILDPSAMEAAARAAKANDTNPSWPSDIDSARPVGDVHEFREGFVLRRRFQLISKLGEGGMGTVWKGTDKLKEEARDRNPYVAIKLLQGDFKEHPEAFIALQRETSKQQRLAHPNIATVYDFDRDTDTGIVFMTMEVLDGADLAAFIRKLPADGLSEAEALPIIEQLAAGLSYAHSHKLVHSDLKPGNAFITQDGNVKLLDFGIARASKTKADAEGETTVFDPGGLGALTPTYATVEMFEGKDPDPRDDIYALAIMAYQLFTGKHPYGKQSAPKAMDQKLVPAYIPKLSKRQNRGLQRGLQFLREGRTSSVEQFMEEIRPKKSHALQISFAAMVLLAIVAGALYNPVHDYLLERRSEEVIALIARGDEQSIESGLARAAAEFPPPIARAIKSDERTRTAIFMLYQSRVDQAVNPDKQSYDYPLAEKQLKELRGLYPDSAQVLQLQHNLKARKDRELSALNDRYNNVLEAGALTADVAADDVFDVLDLVKRIDPDHVLLDSEDLALRYADLVRESIAAKDYERADALLRASQSYAAADPILGNLRYQVGQELDRQRDALLVAQIEQRLEQQVGGFKSVRDFQTARDDLIKLTDLSPSNPVLVSIRKALEEAFSAELAQLIDVKAWDEAETLLVDFARLLGIPYLTEMRATLSRAEANDGYVLGKTAKRTAAAETRKRQMSALLDNPELGSDWELALQAPYKELVASLSAGDPELESLRERTARVYLGRAQRSREAGRFSEALAFVDRGLDFFPGLAAFEQEKAAVADAAQALAAAQATKRRLAQLEKKKRDVIAKAKADQPQEAKKIFAELRTEVDPGDPFLDGASQALADSYLRLARVWAEKAEWKNAETLAREGLDYAPEMPALQTLMSSVADELAKEASISALRDRLSSTAALDFDDVKRRLAQIKSEFPGRFERLSKEFYAVTVARLRKLEKQSLESAHAFRDSAALVFPGIAEVELKPLPSELAARGKRQVATGQLSEASKTLEEAMAKEAGHPDVHDFRDVLQTRIAQAESDFQNFLKFKKARQAKKGQPYLDRAMKYWTDNADYQRELAALTESAEVETTRRGECAPALAGYGTRARGTCYDTLNANTKGPTLVVVPAGSGLSRPFAIGKYEVSIAEYNQCSASGSCRPIAKSETKLPVTGISLDDARRYTRWLSEQSGAVYRLPTEAEWEYAAQADGKQPAKDFNCRVVLGDQMLKGHSLVNARSGKQNGWGLANYVGNAQEWVIGTNGVKVRGGAYQDALSKCDISVGKSHPGDADEVTGFRLVRELS